MMSGTRFSFHDFPPALEQTRMSNTRRVFDGKHGRDAIVHVRFLRVRRFRFVGACWRNSDAIGASTRIVSAALHTPGRCALELTSSSTAMSRSASVKLSVRASKSSFQSGPKRPAASSSCLRRRVALVGARHQRPRTERGRPRGLPALHAACLQPALPAEAGSAARERARKPRQAPPLPLPEHRGNRRPLGTAAGAAARCRLPLLADFVVALRRIRALARPRPIRLGHAREPTPWPLDGAVTPKAPAGRTTPTRTHSHSTAIPDTHAFAAENEPPAPPQALTAGSG